MLSPSRELDFQGCPSWSNITRGFDNFEKSCSRLGQSMISQGPRCPRSCPVSFRKAFRELWEHFAIKFDGQIAKVRSDAASRRLNRAPRSLKIELSRRREHDFHRFAELNFGPHFGVFWTPFWHPVGSVCSPRGATEGPKGVQKGVPKPAWCREAVKGVGYWLGGHWNLSAPGPS